MEVDQNININELLRNLKNKCLNNNNHGEVVTQLLNHYLSVEKTGEFNAISATCLILLLCISGDYEEANLRRTKYKSLKIFKSNEEFTQLFSLSKRFLKEPYLDLYGHIYFFLKSNSLEVNSIALSYLHIYERQQAIYLSKFYTRIKLSSLKKLLGQHFNQDKFSEYLTKYRWTEVDDCIVISPVQVNFDSTKLKSDLEFINKMTVSLENIAKANTCIKPSEV